LVGSGIRDGEKSGSGINIPDPQHCLHEYDLRENDLRENDLRENDLRENDLPEYDLHEYNLREYDPLSTTVVSTTFVNTTFVITTFMSPDIQPREEKNIWEIGIEMKYFNPQKIVRKLSEVMVGSEIRDPEKTYSGSRI